MDDYAPGRGRLTRHGATAEDVSSAIFPSRVISSEGLEAGRRLFAQQTRFVAGAAEASTFPADRLPEVAFAGRSNVGKSSLINALTGRRMLARISNTPGRTRQINFFDLGGRLMLVDLPGYGYAEAPKSAVKSWTSLVRHYLRTRAALRRVCLLIDSRHGIKDIDRPLTGMLDAAGVSYQIILTKADKVKPTALAALIERTEAEARSHPAAHPAILATSAETGTGIAALRAAVLHGIEPPGVNFQ